MKPLDGMNAEVISKYDYGYVSEEQWTSIVRRAAVQREEGAEGNMCEVPATDGTWITDGTAKVSDTITNEDRDERVYNLSTGSASDDDASPGELCLSSITQYKQLLAHLSA